MPDSQDEEAAYVGGEVGRKEKKHDLKEFDKIVQNNFRKKGAAFIDEEQPDRKAKIRAYEDKNQTQHSKDREGSSRKNGSSSSNEGKLGLLLSGSKKDEKKRRRRKNKGEGHEESVSFSSVVSQSVTVRQQVLKR